jgi:uncharacterized protein (TIGR02300 family)
VVSAELGTKRTCPSCSTRFYDLLKNPIVCPNCGVTFIATALLPSKGEHAGPPSKVREPVVSKRVEPEDVELVGIEDVEEPGDETGDIEDVDIGEGRPAPVEEDDTFLIEEEEEGNVSGILGGGKEGDKDT